MSAKANTAQDYYYFLNLEFDPATDPGSEFLPLEGDIYKHICT